MNGKSFNPKVIIKKIVGREPMGEEADQFKVYNEYPKKTRTEPRHMFSGEFPAVVLNTTEECEACPC